MLDECVDPLCNLYSCECLLAEVAGERGRQRLTVNLIARVAGSFLFHFIQIGLSDPAFFKCRDPIPIMRMPHLATTIKSVIFKLFSMIFVSFFSAFNW
jgi:hypothetical protein